MRRDYSSELAPEVKLKMKKNLVYVSIFAIIMMFAGFTSAYIVSMGDTFWIKYPLPLPFWISTAVIVLSSIFYMLAVYFSGKNNFGKVKLYMSLTFFAGILFVVYQFKGYAALVEEGANPSNPILVTEGRYGDYYDIKYLGKFIEVNGNEYTIDGKQLSDKQFDELKKFVKPFEKTAKRSGYKISSLSPNFTLYFKKEPVLLRNNKLVTASAKELQYVDMKRLQSLAFNIGAGLGDFFHKGKLGKDFMVYYKGRKLEYHDRDLYFGRSKLSAPLQLKISGAHDTATSYLFLITVLHLLHVAGCLIYLFRMVLISFKPSLTSDNQLSIKLGSIFWHFLGILWLYLLLFLLFIH